MSKFKLYSGGQSFKLCDSNSYSIDIAEEEKFEYSIDTINKTIIVQILNPSSRTKYLQQNDKLYVAISLRKTGGPHGSGYFDGSVHDRLTRYMYHKKWSVNFSFANAVKVVSFNQPVVLSYNDSDINYVRNLQYIISSHRKAGNPLSEKFIEIRPVLIRALSDYTFYPTDEHCGAYRIKSIKSDIKRLTYSL